MNLSGNLQVCSFRSSIYKGHNGCNSLKDGLSSDKYIDFEVFAPEPSSLCPTSTAV